MPESTYQILKKKRDEERKEIEKLGEPQQLQGWLLPGVLVGWPKEDLYTRGVRVATHIAMATILNATQALGWERFINALNEKQRPHVAKSILEMRKDSGVKGNTLMDATNVIWTWAKGCGFVKHRTVEYRTDSSDAIADWCPQIEALKEMGMLHEAQELSRWCDFYDDLLGQPTNPDAFYMHTHCLARGDSHCRMICDIYEGVDKGGNFYQTIKKMRDERRKEVEKQPAPDLYVQCMGVPRWLESWSDEERLKDGVRTKSRIAHHNMLVAADELGWEKFINLVAEKQDWGFTNTALAKKRDFGITGSTLQDAAALALIGYSMLCFDKHNVVDYSGERVEVIGDWCPIIESAKHMEMEDKVEGISLWCDFFHNHQVHIVNPDYQLTHTHCLGRGDKYCRIVIK